MTKDKYLITEQDQARMLKELQEACVQLKRAEQRVTDAVNMGRARALDGYCALSWAEIGAALGVTKQAAQQRFGYTVTE